MSFLDPHGSCKNTGQPTPLDVLHLANNQTHMELLGSREQPKQMQQNRKKKIPEKRKEQ